jgi:hypothetical protein
MMGITEADFWESTPRKIIALIDQKNRIEKARQKNQAVYIAYYVWGKTPPDDDVIDKTKPVAGRDVPIDPTALKGLMM